MLCDLHSKIWTEDQVILGRSTAFLPMAVAEVILTADLVTGDISATITF